MKINKDCMKHVVEYCIEKQTMSDEGIMSKIVVRDAISDITALGYLKSDIWYSIYKLRELSYITLDCDSTELNGAYSITDVTVDGHIFVEGQTLFV